MKIDATNPAPGSAEPALIDVTIEPDHAPGLVKVAVRSPAGEASALVELPVDALLGRRAEVQSCVLSSSASFGLPPRQIEQPVREIGQSLFTALLGTGAIAGIYRASVALAAEREQRLRVVLRTESAKLASLPWEAMFDPTTGAYLRRLTELVRYVPIPVPVRSLPVAEPLRILGVISSPRGLPPVEVEAERALLTTALTELVASGLVELTWVLDATWASLHAALLAGPWHVVHFIGHGGFDAAGDEGVIALGKADGSEDLVEASRFTDLLGQAGPGPRLVFLNCCFGAAPGADDLFGGTAASIARAGIPAVVAMQFEITNFAAIAFSRGFYGAITQGRDVDSAVSSGRIAILGSHSHTLEWITPVLYLRGQRAQLFAAAPKGTTASTTSEAGQVTSAGRAFISYAEADSSRIDRLQQELSAQGIPVWRDTDELWPGQDWRGQIRDAITRDCLVFLACFSRASTALTISRQNEELALAIEELRLRRPGAVWFIPVRLDDCQIPDWDIGGGRTLASLQPIDVYGENFSRNAERLARSIGRLLA